MLRSLCAGVCALALLAPTAASAQRGGGFHGGGFHGGGFHGGGFRHGWGGRGGYRGGWYGGWGWPGYWGLGLGLGLGGWWAYDAYEPWFYYYPPSLYDVEDDYAGTVPPEPPALDPWVQESAAETGAPPPGPDGGPCGRWSWQADQSRYRWDASGCAAPPAK